MLTELPPRPSPKSQENGAGARPEDEAKRMAGTAFVSDLRGRQRQRAFDEEERQHDDMVGRTNRLRKLRLTKEAANPGHTSPRGED